jgi:ribonuclease BN (tRNA processing enzyme)
MRIRVLGCHGGETPKHRTTSFLIDERITIDAGAVCRSLTLDEQVKIDHMLISHSHMDHVKDLALLADQIIGRRQTPVMLHCGPETAETLRSSYFNNFLWPDFTRIPTPTNPVMQIVVHDRVRTFRFRVDSGHGDATPANGTGANGVAKKATKKVSAKKAPAKSTASSKKKGGELDDGEYEVTYVPVTHPVESMAMIIRTNTGAILYSSDTGPTTNLWKEANKVKDLRGLFVELSFPNHMQALADVAGHYTPQTLDRELHKIDGRDQIPLYVYHLKPTFYDETKTELLSLNLKNMRLVELSDEFTF